MVTLLDYDFDAFLCYEADEPYECQSRIDLEGLEWTWLQGVDLSAWPAFRIEFHGLTNCSWHDRFTLHDFGTTPAEKCAVLRHLAKTHLLVDVTPNMNDRIAPNGMPNVAVFTYVRAPAAGRPRKLKAEISLASHARGTATPQLDFPPFLFRSPFQMCRAVKTAEEAQEELARLDIQSRVRQLYTGGRYTVEDFIGRITQGQRQILVGPAQQNLHLVNGGGGGRDAVVCCVPFSVGKDTSRRDAARGILGSLERVGFQGCFLELVGGYPLELQYAGVPYAFKIFAMLEAQRRHGFTSVIWVDASVRALKNPAPLFDELRRVGALLRCKGGQHDFQSMCLPRTLSLLNGLTHIQLQHAPYIESVVMGLQLDHPDIQRMVKQYYCMVDLGWPFFSIFPEEVVFSALFHQPELRALRENTFNEVLYAHEKYGPNDRVYFLQTNYAPQVTFEDNGGRLGNQLFCHLFCALLHVRYGHRYVPLLEFSARDVDVVTDENAAEYVEQGRARGRNLLLKGFFQQSRFYTPFRAALMERMWPHLPPATTSTLVGPGDVVVSLRLDDFIQYPCPTTDVIPPEFYLSLLAREEFRGRRVVIVTDTIRQDWERAYLTYFPDAIVLQNNLEVDFHLLRTCSTLLHSNSTFCWMASFLSPETKRRVIPVTPKEFMNQNQDLRHISLEDEVVSVRPLTHWRIQRLGPPARIYPLAFSIPDECVVAAVPPKKRLLAPLVPGQLDTYIYTEEQAYYQMYQESRFALTRKKGGWDCLRHYEIMMNGCIPLFIGLDDCPAQTLTTYPKALNAAAWDLYHNWCVDREAEYQTLATRFLEHARAHCTTSAAARYFQRTVPGQSILLIPGFVGRNHYQRDSLWIGVSRLAASVDESEHMDLERDVFTYAGRLPAGRRAPVSKAEISLGMAARPRRWDIVIFGRAGPDEHETFPLLEEVQRHYTRDEIVFLFGGDEPFSFCRVGSHENMFGQHIPYPPYAEELDRRAQQGVCFVRELEFF